MRALHPLLLAPLLALLLAGGAQAQDALPGGADRFESKLQDLARHARARTVLVYGLIGLGSGAVVNTKGRVVTNAHVVAGARYAILQWADGRAVLARRLGIDYGRDLAVLEPVETLPGSVPTYSLAPGAPKKGQWVVGIGFPGGLRTTTEPTVTLGQITGHGGGNQSAAGFLNYEQALRSDLPIFSGNSGGPMIDLRGRLLGINGAVDLERAISLTIPIEVVRERLRALKGGVIVLPGERTLNPDRGLLRGFYRATDAMARQLPERVAQASEQAAQVRGRAPAALQQTPTGRTPSDRLANQARRSPRQAALKSAFQGRSRVIQAQGIALTPVDAHYAVCKASLLGGRSALKVPGGQANVVARSEADDLALLRMPAPRKTVLHDAPARPVGSLVYAQGPEGVLAAGMLSASARPTSATLLARIQQGGAGPLDSITKMLERLAKTLRVKALQDLLEQIKRAGDVRQSFAAGTPPRSYRLVISVDAPVPPSRMGAPVFDRSGRLVGVTIGIAHHGTTYVVPMTRVREVFLSTLGGTIRPKTIGAAKLY